VTHRRTLIGAAARALLAAPLAAEPQPTQVYRIDFLSAGAALTADAP